MKHRTILVNLALITIVASVIYLLMPCKPVWNLFLPEDRVVGISSLGESLITVAETAQRLELRMRDIATCRIQSALEIKLTKQEFLTCSWLLGSNSTRLIAYDPFLLYITVFDVKSGDIVWKLTKEEIPFELIEAIGLSKDGRYLASLFDKELYVWDIVNGKIVRKVELSKSHLQINEPKKNPIAFSDDGSILAVCAGEKTFICNIVTGHVIGTLPIRTMPTFLGSKTFGLVATEARGPMQIWKCTFGPKECSFRHLDMNVVAHSGSCLNLTDSELLITECIRVGERPAWLPKKLWDVTSGWLHHDGLLVRTDQWNLCTEVKTVLASAVVNDLAPPAAQVSIFTRPSSTKSTHIVFVDGQQLALLDPTKTALKNLIAILILSAAAVLLLITTRFKLLRKMPSKISLL